MNFTTDMKRLGMMEDVQDVQETKKKLIIKQRHISPPPNLNSGAGNNETDLGASGDIPNDYNDSKPIHQPNASSSSEQ